MSDSKNITVSYSETSMTVSADYIDTEVDLTSMREWFSKIQEECEETLPDNDTSTVDNRYVRLSTPSFTEQKTKQSSLFFEISENRLLLTRDYNGRTAPMQLVEVLQSAEMYLFDSTTNQKIRDFLVKSFPKNFEREQAYSRFLKVENKGMFYVDNEKPLEIPKESSEDYLNTLLMVIAYSFPALYGNLTDNEIKNGIYVEVADMKLGYADFMSASTHSDLADLAFGTRRKVFRKIAKLMTVSELALIHHISDFVSADDLEIVFKDYPFSDLKINNEYYIEPWYDNMEEIVNLSPTVRRHVLRDIFKIGGPMIDDAFDMLSRYAVDYSVFKGVKTVQELHDRAINLIPELDEDNFLEKLDSAVTLSKIVEIPEHSIELKLLTNQKRFIEIGSELKICIGSASYFEKSLIGKSYCYEILQDDVPIGAMEVQLNKKPREWKLIQCRGERNKDLELGDKITENLLKVLNDKLAESAVKSIREISRIMVPELV